MYLFTHYNASFFLHARPEHAKNTLSWHKNPTQTFMACRSRPLFRLNRQQLVKNAPHRFEARKGIAD
jgi:hypothetical protein